MAGTFFVASMALAHSESITIPANSVSTSKFEICKPAARLVVLPRGGGDLDFAVWDEGQNLILFDTGEDGTLRQQIAKVETLECESFTLVIFNRGEEEVAVDVNLSSSRAMYSALTSRPRGQRGSDESLAMNPAARIPRCPSSDSRCEKGKN